MTEPTDKQPPAPETESRARDAAFDAWTRGAGTDEERPPGLFQRLFPKDSSQPQPGAEDDVVFVPSPRAAFPPSFFLILAAGCAFLALEPTGDLAYELLGPSTAIELGRPGAYNLEAARDGSRAHIFGYAGSVRGTFAQWGSSYEVAPLVGIPVLVRRAPHPSVPADTVEPFDGEGRLLRLDSGPASWFERMARPSSRYATVRMQFEAYNQLPAGRTAWLLLTGDLPRASPWAIAEPILLWLAAVAFIFRARRAYVLRTLASHNRRRI